MTPLRLAFHSLLTFSGALLLTLSSVNAEPVTVRQIEGEIRGYLVLRNSAGMPIADGDLIQTTRGNSVTSRLVFHFKDGSLHDDAATFTQHGHFHLLSDHLVQRGPSFKHPIDMTVNGSTGAVIVKYKTEKGEDKTVAEILSLPDDLANGMLPILLKNIQPGVHAAIYSMVVATPKPMLVKLEVTATGSDPFSTGGRSREATRYVLKIDIGGLKGAVAELIGKQPPDTTVWMLTGECPGFLKMQGPLSAGGDIWQTELVSPVWPK